jgi:hypothetical protein
MFQVENLLYNTGVMDEEDVWSYGSLLIRCRYDNSIDYFETYRVTSRVGEKCQLQYPQVEGYTATYNNNTSIPATMSGYNYFSFRQENPYYLFDYLSRKEIIDAIKCAIVSNKSLAGHLARLTYNTSDTGFMDYYIELISTYERVFGRDIYNPDILL